ncbi:MAG: ABC transporter permease, partial [Bacteroidia bacterium]|nr:ABC transporter permease [Bacteroidia bacterium]
MLRLLSTIQKELLLLMRDKGGLAILFLMPMAMITIMAIIQDAPFRDYQELKIPLLLVNNDTGKVGTQIEMGLKESSIFEITKEAKDNETVKKNVKAGEYEIGIIIPDNATQVLNSNVQQFVASKLSEVGLSEMPIALVDSSELKIQILFTPDTKPSFKASILSSLKQSISKIETQFLLDFFTKELNKENPEAQQSSEKLKEFVSFNEISTLDTPKEALKLNSVQHNVPAWTIFGIFFIVISMAGSII